MKNLKLILALIAVSILLTVAPSFAQISTIGPNNPLNVQTGGIQGYTTMTQVASFVHTNAAQQMPALPAGTRQVTVISDAQWNFGGSDVAIGAHAFGTGFTVATSTAKTFDIAPGVLRPTIYIRPYYYIATPTAFFNFLVTK